MNTIPFGKVTFNIPFCYSKIETSEWKIEIKDSFLKPMRFDGGRLFVFYSKEFWNYKLCLEKTKLHQFIISRFMKFTQTCFKCCPSRSCSCAYKNFLFWWKPRAKCERSRSGQVSMRITIHITERGCRHLLTSHVVTARLGQALGPSSSVGHAAKPRCPPRHVHPKCEATSFICHYCFYTLVISPNHSLICFYCWITLLLETKD